ncbi:MAG: arginine deiminase-related protein, partial [Bacteroidota bacterium]
MIVDTSQCTDTLLMVRPYHFRFNEQTAVNNYYVEESSGAPDDEIYQQAEAEFDNFVDVLRGKGVNVMVIQDNAEPDTPDAVFPNNWISLHSDGRVGLYPMYAPNRRWERREDIVDLLKDNFRVESVVDFTDYELKEQFLEATGSISYSILTVKHHATR